MINIFRLLNLFLSLSVFTSFAFAQGDAKKQIPNGWHLTDKNESGIYGISLDKAYRLLQGKKSTPVVVAVLDSGVDTLQEDLIDVLWRNPKEIPHNGVDDDKNGYVDDIYGWNFLGGKDGSGVTVDSDERSRVYYKFRNQFEGKDINPDTLSKEALYYYNMWTKAKAEMFETNESVDILILKMAYQNLSKADSLLQKVMGKAVFTGEELEKMNPPSERVNWAKSALVELMRANGSMETTNKKFMEEFKEYLDGEQRKADAKEREPEKFREKIVQDNYDDIRDRYYGNNKVFIDAKADLHGTHVAGVIAAKRNNKLGVDGIADNVKIMVVRVVPDGDEHDKDVALGIRYAVDNGAKIINMSFGKYFSPEKKWVDEAVKYAQSKGVLLVAAAGNESRNADSAIHYPNRVMLDGSIATNWIAVGASSDPSIDQITPSDGSPFSSYTAAFSNYGKSQVDVFAPGTRIYSTQPGNSYGNLDGTSFSSPIVAGIAALIMEYFPQLTAEQVKFAIEKSATPLTADVLKPGTNEKVKLADLCKTGAIVNAYEAIKLASTLKAERVNNKLKAF
jgi:subtilisin family serine protease